VTTEQYRRKAERYLVYAGRVTNQHARAAIVDRALECIRLAEAAEPHCTAAKRTIEAVRLDCEVKGLYIQL
jgi:hypothetical protein